MNLESFSPKAWAYRTPEGAWHLHDHGEPCTGLCTLAAVLQATPADLAVTMLQQLSVGGKLAQIEATLCTLLQRQTETNAALSETLDESSKTMAVLAMALRKLEARVKELEAARYPA